MCARIPKFLRSGRGLCREHCRNVLGTWSGRTSTGSIDLALSLSLSFSREPSLARRLKFAVQTPVLILAHWPMAQWLPHRIQPFIGSSLVESPFSHSKKRTHTETTANQRREATHSRGQIQLRLLDALDPKNTRQLFSPGGVGNAQCPPEEHTSKDKLNS